jgi:hypothetical protein
MAFEKVLDFISYQRLFLKLTKSGGDGKLSHFFTIGVDICTDSLPGLLILFCLRENGLMKWPPS